MNLVEQNICELIEKTSNMKEELVLLDFFFANPKELYKLDNKEINSKLEDNEILNSLEKLCKTSVFYSSEIGKRVETIVEGYGYTQSPGLKINAVLGTNTILIAKYLKENNISSQIIKFKSKYSVQLYLLMKEFIFNDDAIRIKDISILSLRIKFDCVNKYDRFSQFKAKVLDTALLDINELILKDKEILEYAYLKSGTTVDTIRFIIKKKD